MVIGTALKSTKRRKIQRKLKNIFGCMNIENRSTHWRSKQIAFKYLRLSSSAFSSLFILTAVHWTSMMIKYKITIIIIIIIHVLHHLHVIFRHLSVAHIAINHSKASKSITFHYKWLFLFFCLLLFLYQFPLCYSIRLHAHFIASINYYYYFKGEWEVDQSVCVMESVYINVAIKMYMLFFFSLFPFRLFVSKWKDQKWKKKKEKENTTTSTHI